MSEPESQYVVYMLDKYAEDYKVRADHTLSSAGLTGTPLSFR